MSDPRVASGVACVCGKLDGLRQFVEGEITWAEYEMIKADLHRAMIAAAEEEAETQRVQHREQ